MGLHIPTDKGSPALPVMMYQFQHAWLWYSDATEGLVWVDQVLEINFGNLESPKDSGSPGMVWRFNISSIRESQLLSMWVPPSDDQLTNCVHGVTIIGLVWLIKKDNYWSILCGTQYGLNIKYKGLKEFCSDQTVLVPLMSSKDFSSSIDHYRTSLARLLFVHKKMVIGHFISQPWYNVNFSLKSAFLCSALGLTSCIWPQ